MGSLGLIKDRFPEGILVPEGVWTEVVEQGRDRPGALEVESTNWITVNKVSDHDFVNFLKNGLTKVRPKLFVWPVNQKQISFY